MKFSLAVVAALLLQAAPKKVDIVSVAGCLRQPSADTWMLVNATDPVPSRANAPEKKELPASAPVGRNQFRLIGVSEFNLPAYKDHAVIVKGLHIKAQPIARLNITSVTTISPSCPAGK
ncbi:MAG TPA: hypothetical protein VFB07_04830 [Vicinamibacterales bacterium]|nr:hypothetical protein [Vicinamibacterales bacterium]